MGRFGFGDGLPVARQVGLTVQDANHACLHGNLTSIRYKPIFGHRKVVIGLFLRAFVSDVIIFFHEAPIFVEDHEFYLAKVCTVRNYRIFDLIPTLQPWSCSFPAAAYNSPPVRTAELVQSRALF